MILVDTSVWVDHLRHGDQGLLDQLRLNNVLIHPLVVGEIAVGQFPSRKTFFDNIFSLSPAVHASHLEVFDMIERHRLYGRGVGFIDCHLLASARISNALLWSRDRRLMAVAADMQVAFPETAH